MRRVRSPSSGRGPVGPRALDACLADAVAAVGADGGARVLLDAGCVPDAVIGDLDSFRPDGVPEDRILRIEGQDDTDFEKCLARIDAPLVLGAGFLGGRADHALAAMNALVRPRSGRRGTCVLVSEVDAVFAVPPRIVLRLPAGTRVSLFPMAPVRGRSEGLHWPIDGLAFAPDGRVGTSNRVAEGTDRVAIETDPPGMIGIVPAELLGSVVEGLGA